MTRNNDEEQLLTPVSLLALMATDPSGSLIVDENSDQSQGDSRVHLNSSLTKRKTATSCVLSQSMAHSQRRSMRIKTAAKHDLKDGRRSQLDSYRRMLESKHRHG